MKHFAVSPSAQLPTFVCRILALTLAFSVINQLCQAQEKPYPPARSLNGGSLFRQYCASCHGLDGKGHGPTASALSVPVPDLTQISARSRGSFPRVRVRNIIEGEESPVAHGSRQMPVWGPVFHQVERDQDLGNVRVDNLASYLESIQRK